MCVQATFFQQSDANGRRTIVHLFNGLDTAAGRGQPKTEVPLREEVVPVHDIRLRLEGAAPKRVHLEPAGVDADTTRADGVTEIRVPPLGVHLMVVAEY